MHYCVPILTVLVLGSACSQARAQGAAEIGRRLQDQAIQQNARAIAEEAEQVRSGHILMGITVAPLRRETLAGRPLPLRNKAVVKEGVVVTRVHPASAAHRAGMKAGDIITSIDGKPIGSHVDFAVMVGVFDLINPPPALCKVSGFTFAKKRYRAASLTIGMPRK